MTPNGPIQACPGAGLAQAGVAVTLSLANRAACAADLPRGVVLMDAGYGTDTALREAIDAPGLSYSLPWRKPGSPASLPQTSVWAAGTAPLPPQAWSGRGRRPKLTRRDAEHRPVSVTALAQGLPAACWQMISWREGTAGTLTSRFARVRVRAAHRDSWRAEPRRAEWLLIEWPEGDAEPAKYWLAAVPQDRPAGHAVRSLGRSGQPPDQVRGAVADRAR